MKSLETVPGYALPIENGACGDREAESIDQVSWRESEITRSGVDRLSGMLDEDLIILSGLRLAGASKFRRGQWFEGFQVLVCSLNCEAGLDPVTQVEVGCELANLLALRFKLEAAIDAAEPTAEVAPALVITSLPYSGVDALSKILQRDNRFRIPSIIRPVGSGAAEEGDRRHFGWEDLLRCTFQSAALESLGHVPSYMRWLQRQDIGEGYRFLRRCLAAMPGNAPWLLASTIHLPELAAFLATFEDSRAVVIHRDPTAVWRDIESDYCSGRKIEKSDRGLRYASVIAGMLDNLIRTADRKEFRDRILHLASRDLFATLREITARVQMTAGPHTFSIETFGFLQREAENCGLRAALPKIYAHAGLPFDLHAADMLLGDRLWSINQGPSRDCFAQGHLYDEILTTFFARYQMYFAQCVGANSRSC